MRACYIDGWRVVKELLLLYMENDSSKVGVRMMGYWVLWHNKVVMMGYWVFSSLITMSRMDRGDIAVDGKPPQL